MLISPAPFFPGVFPRYFQNILKISTRWNLQNSFSPKFVKNILMIHISKVSTSHKRKLQYPLSIYKGEFKSAWHACTLFCLPSLFLFFSRGKNIPKIFPKYPQDIHKIFPFSIGKSSKVLDLLAHCSSPLFVRELFTAVCHSPTISFREHLATAICNPAEPASFCYSDFLRSITFEESRAPHDRYQDKYLWRHGDYGSMLGGQREKEAGKRCINLSMCMICVIVPGWVGGPILATSAISPVSTSCVTSLALGMGFSGMCVIH